MGKDRRIRSLSLDCSRASPYPCSSSSGDAMQCKADIKTEIPVESVKDEREWEEARCPICLEPPHNAVLLRCSSFELGCRPYMCDTSYRHSNCLDQFFKTSAPIPSTPSTEIPEEIPPTSMNSYMVRAEASQPGQFRGDVRLLWQNLMCPLCRGEIHGYVVVEAARQFMNSKVRCCSCEDCDFSGTYSELRTHARSEHPSIRPTDVDPLRERGWRRLENIRSLRDLVSAVQTSLPDISNREPQNYMNYHNFVRSVLQIYLFYESQGINSGNELEGEEPNNRSSERPLRFRYSRETNRTPRQRSINELQSERAHGGRQNMEANRSPRWINNLQSGRVNYGRNNVENDHSSRQTDNSQPWRSQNGQGLRWRGQQRSG